MNETMLDNYMHIKNQVYENLIPSNVENAMVSEANWIARGTCKSGEDVGIHVKVGDVVFLDFGQAYLNEMGYQHFGLVMCVCEKKALVIPITSNVKTCSNAFDLDNLQGKKNLYCMESIPGLIKRSVLFLNDMKFINTARIIDIKGHIDVRSSDFRKIQMRIMQMVFGKRAM